MTIEEKYIKHEPIEAILTRPDTFIGNDQKVGDIMFIFNGEQMIQKEVYYTPAFLKIFDEILSNAVDHSLEDRFLNKIEVDINKENGLISITNNGKGIPVEIHKKYNKYVPELIFGELNTSSNYNDAEKRTKAGRNGLGAKATNIFSKYFVVETLDENNKILFKKMWKNNMLEPQENQIKKGVNKKGYAKITFLPDYPRFQMKNLEEDTYLLLVKRVYDAIPCTDKKISIYLNGEKLKQNDFCSYINLYPIQNVLIDYSETVIENSTFLWNIGVGKNKSGIFQQVSFVNGTATTRGGTHINYILNQITKKLSELIEKKKKIANVKQQTIKDNLFLFIQLVTENPKFSSQTKEELTTQSKDYTLKYKVSDEFVEKIYKKNTELINEIVDLSNYKNNKSLSKTDGTATRKLTNLNIPKLDDAHLAGTKRSNECTLILVEGDSAKQFVLQGISLLKNGRDYFGIFPLKGKVLNVKKASQTQASANEELIKIKKIIGLEHNKVYTDTKSLRYGKILTITDQDTDGMHIQALINNVFHTWWPELLSLKGFMNSLRTPIIKVFKNNEVIKEFFSEYEYHQWENENKNKTYNIKYYKGLGTSQKKDAEEVFNNYIKNLITYLPDSEMNESFELAFNDKLADKRKIWLSQYEKSNILEFTQNDVTFSELINKGLIHFSMYDNIRSIPGIDGLKPSQRKILHTLFEKMGNIQEIKVANLAGKVSDYTEYHHGEASLMGCIITLAQNYIGTNNYNLLEPRGQFGTRETGKSASPRYIFTCLSKYARLLFHEKDFPILNYINLEGKRIEPEYYLPLIPISLLNGAEGIGTGYSTFIPPYKMKDLIKNILIYLETKNVKKMEELIPWYRHFKGDIEPNGDNKFILYGKYTKINDYTLKITELPPTIITDTYKENVLMGKLLAENIITENIKDNSNTEIVDITIEFTDKTYLKNNEEIEIYKILKLYKNISCNNFYLFDKDYKIKLYKNANYILQEFIELRLNYYTKQKAYYLEFYNKKILELKNKIRFLEEIMNDILVIYKKTSSQVNEILTINKYDKIENSYTYLRTMQIDSFTKDKLDKLIKEFKENEEKYNELKNKTESQLYKCDLSELYKNA